MSLDHFIMHKFLFSEAIHAPLYSKCPHEKILGVNISLNPGTLGAEKFSSLEIFQKCFENL